MNEILIVPGIKLIFGLCYGCDYCNRTKNIWTYYGYIMIYAVMLLIGLSPILALSPDDTRNNLSHTRMYSSSRLSPETLMQLQSESQMKRPAVIHDPSANLFPFFDNSTNRNVTTQVSKAAYLHCRVRNLGDRLVSWIRQNDLHILTVGRDTYTNDQRFQAFHVEHSDDWTLLIRYPQRRDAGVYECQVSTEPKISLEVNLNVVVAKASILGMRDIYLKTGSTINITCLIDQPHHPQSFVFWNHNGRVINHDSPRGGIMVEMTKGDVTMSRLLITNARPADSGNYMCQPSSAESANVTVFVLNGEKPGALHHPTQSSATSWRHLNSWRVIQLLSNYNIIITEQFSLCLCLTFCLIQRNLLPWINR